VAEVHLDLEGVGQREAEAGDGRPAVGPDADLRVGGDLLGQFHGAVEGLAGGHHLLGQAEQPGPVGVDLDPVSIIHSALPIPTMRASRCVPPSASDSPQRC
jgi:hypothetical protein